MMANLRGRNNRSDQEASTIIEMNKNNQTTHIQEPRP